MMYQISSLSLFSSSGQTAVKLSGAEAADVSDRCIHKFGGRPGRATVGYTNPLAVRAFSPQNLLPLSTLPDYIS